MINHLKLVNFKNHRDTELSFGRITALIGPNSAGKSSILQAINYLSQLADEESNKVFSGISDENILTQYGKNHFRIEVKGQEDSTKWSAQIYLSQKNHNEHSSWHPQLVWEYDGDGGKITTDYPSFKLQTSLASILKAIVWLKLNSTNLSNPSFTFDVKPQIASDGANLASAIAYLITAEPERFAKLIDALHDVIPYVQRIRTQYKLLSDDEFQRELTRIPRKGDELLFDMVGAQGVPAHAVSEGTLLVVGLLTALMGPNDPNLLLIDDLEQGLHPKAQRDFIEVLKKLLKARPDLQIIFTSHSPYIVDELDADDVWLLATDDEGISHAKKLSDHPDAKRALEVLTTGEFWSAEGEEWVLENNQ